MSVLSDVATAYASLLSTALAFITIRQWHQQRPRLRVTIEAELHQAEDGSLSTEAIVVKGTSCGVQPISLTGAGYRVRSEKWPRFVGIHDTRNQRKLEQTVQTSYRVPTAGLPASADIHCFCLRDTEQRWHGSGRRFTRKYLSRYPWSKATQKPSAKVSPGEPIFRLPKDGF